MTDILSWLSDRMAAPQEPRPRNFTRAPAAPLTPKLKLRVGAYYLAGKPLKVIAHEAGCHIDTVSAVRRELGLPLREPVKAARISLSMRGRRG